MELFLYIRKPGGLLLLVVKISTSSLPLRRFFLQVEIFENAGFSFTCGRRWFHASKLHHLNTSWQDACSVNKVCYRISIVFVWTGENDSNTLRFQNNNFAGASRFFEHFVAVVERLRRETSQFRLLWRTWTQDNDFLKFSFSKLSLRSRKGTLGISGWGCAAATLEPLTYTRASLAEFCYPILE